MSIYDDNKIELTDDMPKTRLKINSTLENSNSIIRTNSSYHENMIYESGVINRANKINIPTLYIRDTDISSFFTGTSQAGGAIDSFRSDVGPNQEEGFPFIDVLWTRKSNKDTFLITAKGIDENEVVDRIVENSSWWPQPLASENLKPKIYAYLDMLNQNRFYIVVSTLSSAGHMYVVKYVYDTTLDTLEYVMSTNTASPDSIGLTSIFSYDQIFDSYTNIVKCMVIGLNGSGEKVSKIYSTDFSNDAVSEYTTIIYDNGTEVELASMMLVNEIRGDIFRFSSNTFSEGAICYLKPDGKLAIKKSAEITITTDEFVFGLISESQTNPSMEKTDFDILAFVKLGGNEHGIITGNNQRYLTVLSDIKNNELILFTIELNSAGTSVESRHIRRIPFKDFIGGEIDSIGRVGDMLATFNTNSNMLTVKGFIVNSVTLEEDIFFAVIPLVGLISKTYFSINTENGNEGFSKNGSVIDLTNGIRYTFNDMFSLFESAFNVYVKPFNGTGLLAVNRITNLCKIINSYTFGNSISFEDTIISRYVDELGQCIKINDINGIN